MLKLFQNAKVRGAALIVFLLGIVAVASSVKGGFDVLSWVLQQADTPVFVGVVLALFVFLMYTGTKEVVEAQKEGNYADEKLIEDLREMLREARVLPVLLAEQWHGRGIILAMKSALAEIRDAIKTWDASITLLRNGDGQRSAVDEMNRAQRSFTDNVEALTKYARIDLPNPQFEPQRAPIFSVKPGYEEQIGVRAVIFTPADNEEWLGDASKHHQRMMETKDRIEGAFDDLYQRIEGVSAQVSQERENLLKAR